MNEPEVHHPLDERESAKHFQDLIVLVKSLSTPEAYCPLGKICFILLLLDSGSCSDFSLNTFSRQSLPNTYITAWLEAPISRTVAKGYLSHNRHMHMTPLSQILWELLSKMVLFGAVSLHKGGRLATKATHVPH